MEELVRSKMIKIEVGENEYVLGFPTRKDAKFAEARGLNLLETSQTLVLADKLFYTGMLAKQPEITEEEAEKIEEPFIEEGGMLEDVISFLSQQYLAFIQSPSPKKNAKKKSMIIEM